MSGFPRVVAVLLLAAIPMGGCGWFSRSTLSPGGSVSESVREREASRASPVTAGQPRLIPSAQDAQDIVDRIVAVVNNEAITLSELLEHVVYYLYESRQRIPQEGEQALKERLLRRMVEARLQLQEANREKITVEDSEITEQLAEVMKRAGVKSQEEFERLVTAQGLTMESVRKRLREQLMIQKVIRRKVTLRISVTEDEMERYFLENRAKLETGSSYQARHILIGPHAPAGDAEWETARLKAEEVWELVRAGQDFAELARTYSRDPSASEGGDLGVLKQGELDSEIEAQILRIRPGEAAAPFRSRLGYHIFKLEWKEGLTGQALNQTKQQIRDLLFREKYKARLEAWFEEIKRRAIIEIRM